MSRVAWLLGPALLVFAVRLGGQAPATQPVFRGGTDLVQVDVSVLDAQRRPVRGLTAADFTLREDDQPREIQAFTEVDLPALVRTDTATWLREVPRDVASNQTTDEDGRLVIIVLDRTIPAGVSTVTARRTAAAVVSQLGPNDLAAVVSTSGGATQNLTSDRGRLLRAIDESDLSADMSLDAKEVEEQLWLLSGIPYPSPLSDGRCLCKVCVLDTITRVADAVQATPTRRKVMFFIGSDLVLQSTNTVVSTGMDVGCETRLKDARNAMFTAIDRANLTIHSLDPTGLSTIGPISQTSSALTAANAKYFQSRDTNEHLQRQGALRVLPDRTGGRAIMNTNAPDLHVAEIFRESDSYYLIGFRPADPAATGRFHTISVKANRSGLDVRARNGYTAASAPAKPAGKPTPGLLPEAIRASLNGLLPSSRIPLDVSAATFATPGSDRAAVTLTVGVGAFVGTSTPGGPLEVVAAAFDRRGRSKGVARQAIDLSWPAIATTAAPRFDVLSRLDLVPGEYEIRVSVSGAEPTRAASVFTYVTVPPFHSAPLSLSNIVVGATAGTLTAPKDFLAPVLPIVPTPRRDFTRADKLVAFLRVYQGTRRQDPLQPVQLRASVTNAQGNVVGSESALLGVRDFSTERAANHYLALPLATLATGEYLLRIETDMGTRHAGRVMRFSLK
jgi:VWFA-related protein